MKIKTEEEQIPGYQHVMSSNRVKPVVSQASVDVYHYQSNETNSVSQQNAISSDICRESIRDKTKGGNLCRHCGPNCVYFFCTECCVKCCVQSCVMCITGLCKGGV